MPRRLNIAAPITLTLPVLAEGKPSLCRRLSGVNHPFQRQVRQTFFSVTAPNVCVCPAKPNLFQVLARASLLLPQGRPKFASLFMDCECLIRISDKIGRASCRERV